MEGESYHALRQFFEGAGDARVNVALPEGTARFTMETGAPDLLPGAAPDPDFTLHLPDGAVRRITSLGSDDVGEFGVEFFRLVLRFQPSHRPEPCSAE